MRFPAEHPCADTVARLEAAANRELSEAEVVAALAVPISDEERAEVLELCAWFRRRYPTALERLAYARRASARWARAMPAWHVNRVGR